MTLKVVTDMWFLGFPALWVIWALVIANRSWWSCGPTFLGWRPTCVLGMVVGTAVPFTQLVLVDTVLRETGISTLRRLLWIIFLAICPVLSVSAYYFWRMRRMSWGSTAFSNLG